MQQVPDKVTEASVGSRQTWAFRSDFCCYDAVFALRSSKRSAQKCREIEDFL